MKIIKCLLRWLYRFFGYFFCTVAVFTAITGIICLFTEGWFGILFLPIAGFIFAVGRAVKKNGEEKEPEPTSAVISGGLTVEEFYVAGANYYKENIMKLAVRNELWRKQTKTLLADGKEGKCVYRYNFIHKPVKLIPEPTNEVDKNAVIVQIAGEKVGYIRAEEALHVKDILAKHDIKYVSAFIGGGEYKIPREDGTLVRGEDDFTIKVKIGYKA